MIIPLEQIKESSIQTKPFTFIEISFDEYGRITTKFVPFKGCDPIAIGVALASATRVITEGVMKEIGLPEVHREEIKAMIATVYNRDLGWESMGEEKTTEKL
jgi:hypothetical protein